MSQLCVFGAHDDDSIQSVCTELYRRDIKSLIFDPIDCTPKTIDFKGANVTYAISLREHNSDRKQVVDPSDLLIWLRNKRRVDVIETKYDQELFVTIKENIVFMSSLITGLNLTYFNPRPGPISNLDKAKELQIAKNSGLSIPATIVSNDPDIIRNFVRNHKSCITKSFYQSFLPAPLDGSLEAMSIFTTPVNAVDLPAINDDALSVFPAIYQENIAKNHELRIIATRFGAVFYKIDSQNSKNGSQDWRYAQFEDIYSHVPSDHSIAQKLAFFLEVQGLHYGVFDFVVTVDGKAIFLECNIDGQWIWLELVCGHKLVTNLLADMIQQML